MDTFTIWALVSTILFVLYMGTNIVLDMKGAAKAKSSRVEEFKNVESDAYEDDSTVVEEDYLESGENVVQESTPSIRSEGNEPYDTDSGIITEQAEKSDIQKTNNQLDEQDSMYQKLKRQAANNMETVLPSYQEELMSLEFQIAMSQPLSQDSRIEMKRLTW